MFSLTVMTFLDLFINFNSCGGCLTLCSNFFPSLNPQPRNITEASTHKLSGNFPAHVAFILSVIFINKHSNSCLQFLFMMFSIRKLVFYYFFTLKLIRKASYPAGPRAESLHLGPETNKWYVLSSLDLIEQHKHIGKASNFNTYHTRSPSLKLSDMVHVRSLQLSTTN